MIKQRMSRGLLWMGGSRAFQQALHWVLNVFVARLLVPADYGLMALANVVIHFTNYFFELSIGQALVQREELHDDEQDAAFWLMMTLSGVVYAACFLVSGQVAAFFDEPRLESILKVYASSFMVLALGIVPTSVLQRQLRFRVLAMRNVVADSVSAVVVLVLAVLGHGVWSLVVGAMLRNILYTGYCFGRAGWFPRLRFRWQRVRPLLDFGFSVTLSKFMNTAVSNADTFIIGKLLGTTTLGYYYMAQRFTVMPVIRAAHVFFEVNFPVMSKIQGRMDIFRSSLQRMTGYIAVFAVPAFTGLFLLSEPLVLLLIGEKWAPITPLIRILCVAGVLRSVLAPLSSMVLALGDTGAFLRFNLLSLVFIPASLYLGALVDVRTVLLTWVVTYPLVSLPLLLSLVRRTGLTMREYVRSFTFPLLPTGVMAAFLVGLGYCFPSTTLARLVPTIVGGGVVYAAYYYVMRRQYVLETVAFFRRRE